MFYLSFSIGFEKNLIKKKLIFVVQLCNMNSDSTQQAQQPFSTQTIPNQYSQQPIQRPGFPINQQPLYNKLNIPQNGIQNTFQPNTGNISTVPPQLINSNPINPMNNQQKANIPTELLSQRNRSNTIGPRSNNDNTTLPNNQNTLYGQNTLGIPIPQSNSNPSCTQFPQNSQTQFNVADPKRPKRLTEDTNNRQQQTQPKPHPVTTN